MRHFIVAVLSTALMVPVAGAASWRVYVGTYTSGERKGIYRLAFDDVSGATTLEGVAAETKNPSFLALHPTKPVLYACAEEEAGAGVAAYAVDDATGGLALLNHQPAGGSACHVSVSPDGRYVGVANYGAGSCAVYPVGEHGSLGPALATFQHEGNSVNPKRQTGPHAHSANFDPAGRFLIVPDLGMDKLLVYRFAATSVVPNDPPFASVEPGSGPRHFAFHPTKPWAYVVNEMGNTVTVFQWDAEKGMLAAIQTVGTLPEEFREESTAAHIEVHPSGKFLYVSNRGHDSIAAFAMDQVTGTLTARGQTKTGGKTPRNFTQEPSGKYLLAANQNSNDLFVFAIDQETGALTPTGTSIAVPMPVCVVFSRR